MATRPMPPSWRLATSSLSARRGRTALLIGCVALCAALIVAIRCAIASLNAGLDQRLTATIGAAELRVLQAGKAPFDMAVLDAVRAWPETKLASPRLTDGFTLQFRKGIEPAKAVRVIAYGVDPATERDVRPLTLASGSWLTDEANTIVLDQRVADELGAGAGDTVEVQRFGEPVRLRVVGVAKPPPLSGLFKNILPVYGSLATVARAAERGEIGGRPGINEVDIVVKPEFVPQAVIYQHQNAKPDPAIRGLLLQPTEKITAGFREGQRSGDIGLLLASIIAFLASGFIITTGMTTAVGERLRELSIVRAVGGTRTQLAASQLLTGAIIGGCGALVGVPLGMLGADVLIKMYPEQLPAGFVFSWVGVISGVVGSVFAGMIGAAYAAWLASRVSPSAGIASRAKPVAIRTIWMCLVVGLALISVQLLIIQFRPSDTDRFFWLYVPIAVPTLITGYFVLSIAVMYAVSVVIGPVLARLLGLPGVLLSRSLTRTPIRSGLTAGSMMLGLALLISIWTNGKSVLDRWFESLQFPDAFVTGISLKPDVADRIRTVSGVASACPITLFNVDTDAFGIQGLTRYRTTFLAFEPEVFFDMTKVQWIQGDEATARRELAKGGAVIVAREFFVTRKLGVGDSITLKHNDIGHTFRIVGVVTSPGLDIASKFFDIGEGYVDQAINSVFGTREDLRQRFGSESVNLVQIAFKPDADPEQSMRAIRNLRGTGILAGGTATAMKVEIRSMISGTLKVFSLVAVGAMLVACFGVANVIVASVRARSFEFGVIRAAGAPRSLLTRLVIGEGLLISIAAAIVGTPFGIQGAWGGQNITAASIGIDLMLSPPWEAIALGAVTVTAITMLAALPSAIGLMRQSPRALLGAMRG